MRCGALGGTFDPPHLAHLVLAAVARQQLRLDRVVCIPAGEPWRKAEGHLSPPEARLRMLTAAVEPLPWAEVSAIEVERPGPTYAAETLRELTTGGDDDWWFIMGEDALADLPYWHEPRRLVSLARLAVASRPPRQLEISAQLRSLVPDIEQRIDVIEMPPLELSSTVLRRRIAAGEPTDVVLPEAVRRIADELGLYHRSDEG